MGQGLNTKVCQVVAHFLRAPLEVVHVKPSTEHVSPNSFPTGASQASDAVGHVSYQRKEEYFLYLLTMWEGILILFQL